MRRVQAHGVAATAFGRTGGRQRFEFGARSAHVCQPHDGGGAGQVECHAQDANTAQALVGRYEASGVAGHGDLPIDCVGRS